MRAQNEQKIRIGGFSKQNRQPLINITIRKGNKMKNGIRLSVFTGFIIVWILTFSLISSPVYAEENKSNNDGVATSDMEILREKVKADKKLLVAANLDLTETEAQAFWPIYEEFQNQLTSLNEQIGSLIMEYADNYNTMDDETAKKLLNDSLMLEEKRVELKQLYMPKFQEALPAIKLARYYQIENKIQAALQYELAAGIPLMK
jgi:hypothetical protein